MSELVVEGRAVPVEVAESYRARARGLLGRDGIDGAFVLRPARQVHTFGMRFPIDAVLLDRDDRVVTVVTIEPGRILLPRRRVRHVLEVAAGRGAALGL